MKKRKNRFLDGMAVALESEYGEAFVSNVMDKAWKNYEKLISENKDEPKAMWVHTRERIYPGIAIFNALKKVDRQCPAGWPRDPLWPCGIFLFRDVSMHLQVRSTP